MQFLIDLDVRMYYPFYVDLLSTNMLAETDLKLDFR